MHTVRVAAALILMGIAESQSSPGSLTVSGRVGNAPVVRLNGKNYVDDDALARITSSSLSFAGNQLTLTLGVAGGAAPSATTPTSSNIAPENKLSSGFMRAGIEAIATIREWHSALAIAIENSHPVTRVGLARYQGQATTSLQVAELRQQRAQTIGVSP